MATKHVWDRDVLSIHTGVPSNGNRAPSNAAAKWIFITATYQRLNALPRRLEPYRSEKRDGLCARNTATRKGGLGTLSEGNLRCTNMATKTVKSKLRLLQGGGWRIWGESCKVKKIEGVQ